MDRSRSTQNGPALRAALAGVALAALAACDGPMDLDMRGRMGGPLDTSEAAVNAAAPRPEPDDRGVISYPNYQVAVARRGDTLADVATRVDLPAEELARFNGIQPGDTLRRGEIVALPRRVAEPTAATGGQSAQAIRPADDIDITTLASNAIDSAPGQPSRSSSGQSGGASSDGAGVEPVRHQVKRGETAYTIARLYDVSPRALADWNGLDENLSLREGQYLLIPVAQAQPAPAATPKSQVSQPGQGSPTPTPPSASKPLPEETPKAASEKPPKPETPAPDIGKTTKASSSDSQMTMPVDGSIIREYSKGKNEGIDIAAAAGTPVKAADSGTVAAITRNTDDVQILVIKHSGDLLTVYTHIDGITVSKGAKVSRGQVVGKVKSGDPARMHFEVRNGFESVDPMSYLR